MVRTGLFSRSLIAPALLLTACGSGVGNAAPRVSSIPAQNTTGGTAFSLDLSSYVSDREGDSLVYKVVSGGGGFSGSTYSNTFDTMGTYTVEFEVAGGGKSSISSFNVRVRTADYAVVRVDSSGLELLDTDTRNFLTVTANSSTPSLGTGLAAGHLVYQLSFGGSLQLWVFDPATRENVRLQSDASGSVTYRTRTSEDLVIFTTGSPGDTDLFAYDTDVELVREISGVDGELDGDAVVNDADLVYYERGSSGQADIYYYDPSEDESTAVSTNSRDEQIQTVLADGGVVFSRVGAGGEGDLFYFDLGTGLVEVGSDVTGLDSLDKTYRGRSSQSHVVFSAVDGANTGLYAWDPATGQTATIDTGGTATFNAVTANDEVVWTDEVSSTDHDLHAYDLGDDSAAAIEDSTDKLTFAAVTTDGTNSYVVYQSTTTTELDVYDLTGSSLATASDGAAIGYVATLANGDVVYQRTDQSTIALWDVSAGSSPFSTSGTSLTYEGDGPDAGDFVYTGSVSSQTDLFFYDASATSTVTVGNASTDEDFGAVTEDGDVLFTRTDGDGHDQLWIYDVSGASRTRLTDEDAAGQKHDHAVLGTYTGDNR